MKKLDELNYYEILQIPSGASNETIEHAYGEALSIYGEDALATYCLFSDNDRENILELVEKAYMTLINEDKRAAYNDELAASGRLKEPILPKDSKHPSTLFLSDYQNREKHRNNLKLHVQRTETDSYSQEIAQLLDICSKDIELLNKDRQGVKNRLKLLDMKEKIHNNGMVAGLEPELLTVCTEIEKSSLRRQRKISIIIFSYTLFAHASFITLAVSNAIILPGFNIPYTVLLMGLIGCIFGMWLRLPNIGSKQSLRYDLIVWFVICPPVAVTAAGLSFGIAQVLLPLFQIVLPDESWIFWLLAFAFGFVNWVYVYDKLSGIFAKRRRRDQQSKPECS